MAHLSTTMITLTSCIVTRIELLSIQRYGIDGWLGYSGNERLHGAVAPVYQLAFKYVITRLDISFATFAMTLIFLKVRSIERYTVGFALTNALQQLHRQTQKLG